MTSCPHCSRTLLSHASARCNWCGMEIQDAQYQEQAQSERDAYYAHQREHDATSLWRIENININSKDPIIGMVPFGTNSASAAQQRWLGASARQARKESVIPPPVAPAPKADYFRMASEDHDPKPEGDAREPEPGDNFPKSRFNHLEIE